MQETFQSVLDFEHKALDSERHDVTTKKIWVNRFCSTFKKKVFIYLEKILNALKPKIKRLKK